MTTTHDSDSGHYIECECGTCDGVHWIGDPFRDQSNDVFIADEMATDNVAVINQAGYCKPCQAFYEYPNHTH